MRPEHLRMSLANLAWSKDSNPHWQREGLDENAIHALLVAVTLRHLGQYQEARDVLQKEILSHDWQEFRGPLKDDWPCPSAHYEMAVICWMQRRGMENESALLGECREWLDKAANWESYEMDTRWVHDLSNKIPLIVSKDRDQDHDGP